jgi:hypothetical protein
VQVTQNPPRSSENGKLFQEAVMTIVSSWLASGFVTDAFVDYMNDPTKVRTRLSSSYGLGAGDGLELGRISSTSP